jgi:hypothetical protein
MEKMKKLVSGLRQLTTSVLQRTGKAVTGVKYKAINTLNFSREWINLKLMRLHPLKQYIQKDIFDNLITFAKVSLFYSIVISIIRWGLLGQFDIPFLVGSGFAYNLVFDAVERFKESAK